MNAFVNFSVESAAILACLLLFYELLLKKEKFLKYNRFYLLLTPVLALGLPLLTFTITRHANAPEESLDFLYELPLMVSEMTTIVEPQTVVIPAWVGTLQLIYLIGAAIALIRFYAKIIQIRNLIRNRRFKRKYVGNYVLVITDGGMPTFTFLNYLFLNG